MDLLSNSLCRPICVIVFLTIRDFFLTACICITLLNLHLVSPCMYACVCVCVCVCMGCVSLIFLTKDFFPDSTHIIYMQHACAMCTMCVCVCVCTCMGCVSLIFLTKNVFPDSTHIIYMQHACAMCTMCVCVCVCTCMCVHVHGVCVSHFPDKGLFS